MNLEKIASHDRERWTATADRAIGNVETRLFINGEYVDSVDGGRFTTVNPANGETLAEMSEGQPEDIAERHQSAFRGIGFRCLERLLVRFTGRRSTAMGGATALSHNDVDAGTNTNADSRHIGAANAAMMVPVTSM